MKLSKMMAQACHYAQSHIDDCVAWPKDKTNRENLLQCTSFQMACFFAQNTVKGENGVDWSVVIEKLVGKIQSQESWEKYINKIASELGGWKI